MVADQPAVSSVQTPEEREQIAQAMRGRILNVLPAATYQMDRFLQLADVVVSDRTDTACVETGPQPRLHLNDGFVEEYCQRDEHLLMLVMHELYHVILGHTRLFPRLTVAHNIVFDAVINSMLCHQFPDEPYVSFFRQVNPSDDFPARLLRPPSGWPNGVLSLPSSVSDKEKAVVSLLYGKRPDTVTYHEIFELLKHDMPSPDAHRARDGDKSTEGGEASQGPKEGEFILLGDHDAAGGAGEHDDVAVNDALLKEVLRRVTEEWPSNANPAVGRGTGGRIFDFLMPKPKLPRGEFLKALHRLLSRAQVLQPPAGSPYGWKRVMCVQDAMTVLPNLRDRHAHSREALLGEMPVLYRCSVDHSRLRWSPQNMTHIYADVSGSMSDILPWLWAALEPLHRRGICRVYAFSTIVDTVRRGALASGKFKNTGGTDINCVYEHLLKIPARRAPNRLVVLTDGWTGVPRQDLAAEFKKRRTKLYVGLVGAVDAQTLRPYAELMERLPDPKSN